MPRPDYVWLLEKRDSGLPSARKRLIGVESILTRAAKKV